MIIVSILALLFITVLGTQMAFFYHILMHDKPLEKADLIVVFAGRSDRAKEGYRLIDRNYAPNLVISPATESKLSVYKNKYLPNRPVNRIVEGNSRTTLENAVYTKEIMTERHLNSAILVTSWDHMPRSYFLLRLLRLGTGIRVQTHKVATGRLNSANWFRNKLGWKMVYNEMVDVWGSLFEYANYQIKDRLPEHTSGGSVFFSRMRQLLLFEIDEKSLSSVHLYIRFA